MKNDEAAFMRTVGKAAQGMAEMIECLAQIRDNPEFDDKDREWSALNAVLCWMETLPHTSTDPSLLQPLRALCARLAPNLGSGRGDISKFTMRAAALGTVDILREQGRSVGEAQKMVAAKMSGCGFPTKARTISSWTEGSAADQWRKVRKGTADRIREACPPKHCLEDYALWWLGGIITGYVRQET